VAGAVLVTSSDSISGSTLAPLSSRTHISTRGCSLKCTLKNPGGVEGPNTSGGKYGPSLLGQSTGWLGRCVVGAVLVVMADDKSGSLDLLSIRLYISSRRSKVSVGGVVGGLYDVLEFRLKSHTMVVLKQSLYQSTAYRRRLMTLK